MQSNLVFSVGNGTFITLLIEILSLGLGPKAARLISSLLGKGRRKDEGS